MTMPLVDIDGVVSTMTEDDYAKLLRYESEAAKHPAPKTPEQRIKELEAQLAALTEGYAEGVNQA